MELLAQFLKRSEREKDSGRFFAGYEPDVYLAKEFVGTSESFKTFNRLISHATDNLFASLFNKMKEDIFTLRFKNTKFSDVSDTDFTTLKLVV